MSESPWPEPSTNAAAWVAPSAVVIGDVVLENGASIWPTAVARGDMSSIRIGARSNVQDGTVLHGDPGEPVVIGADVTIGHRAVGLYRSGIHHHAAELCHKHHQQHPHQHRQGGGGNEAQTHRRR